MKSGRVEVIRSDFHRRSLRLVLAAVEGYAERFFEDGLAGVPSAIGQCGLGSKRTVSRELSAKAESFIVSIQEFLCRNLPPKGWNVLLGGRIGFAIKGKHQASAVLRVIAGEKNAPASSRTSCVLLVYKAPSAVGEVPGWLMRERAQRLVTMVPSQVASTEVMEALSESTADLGERKNESDQLKQDTSTRSDSVILVPKESLSSEVNVYGNTKRE